MSTLQTPTAKKQEQITEIHHTKLIDEYAWLRSKNWPDQLSDADIIHYLESENQFFEAYMSPNQSRKDSLFEELKGRIKLTDQSTYTKKDEYYYYSRTEEEKEYDIYCRKKGSINAEEHILLDVNELAKGKEYTAVGDISFSPDHRFMCYSSDFTGGEKYTINVYDLEKKAFLEDQIPDTIGSIVWHETLPGFFYTPVDSNWRYNKVKFHKLGDNYTNDSLILHESDILYSTDVRKSSSKKHIIITVSGHDNNEEYLIDMKDNTLKPVLVKARKEKVLYTLDHGENFFYMHTNDQGADKFKILRCPDNKDPSIFGHWEMYITEKKDRDLSNFDITKRYILLNYTYHALPLLIVKEFSSGEEKTISFPDSAYTAYSFSANFEEDDIRINYTSLSRPSTFYQYDYEKENLSILKIQEIPTGHNPDDYMVERIFATSSDGTKIPISLVYKKSLFKKDGSNPLYLYGYGSYGIGVSPSFSISALSLVNRGFIYAIAHIRGGNDVDYDWYKAAKFLTKKRTFEDFIAVAEHVIAEHYTSIGNIAIMGGSAGGLLIGVTINERPELFKLAIAHVPFVDFLNTMLDEELPLTPQEYKEWGNPNDKEYFDYMLTYSPYENVAKKDYPHLFVTAGLSDPRVGYWEAAKWVARLRDQKTDDNLIILKTNMQYGHSGASGRFDYLREKTEDLVFILERFGM